MSADSEWPDVKTSLEEAAKALYHNGGAMTDAECLKILGYARPPWQALNEWERDEYREMARATINAYLSFKASVSMKGASA